MSKNSWLHRRFILLVLFFPVLLSPDAFAVKRILLVGDSWAQWPWKMGSYQAVLNYNYGTGTYEVEGTYTALGGTTADQWANNAVPPESTFPSPPGYTNMPMLDRVNWSLAHWPTIDIICLSITGNDMWSWRANWTPEQTNALYDSIQADLQTLVNWFRTNHPTKKILHIGYDYLNITETCTYGMQEFSWNSVYFATGLGFTVGDIWQNKANNQVINQFFVGMGERNKNVALATPRWDFLNNFGVNHYVNGYTNSLGTIFSPGTTVFPGHYPNYTPMAGGDVTYGTAPMQMNKPEANKNYRDPIHLNDQGYKTLFNNAVMQYLNGWLTDSSAPSVLSINRVNPSPTEANEVAFTVTFNEAVRGVNASDFELTGSSAAGASITAVEGAEDTATRTVRVDISGAPNGTLGLNLVDDGSIYDKNWNQLGGEGAGNGSFTAGQMYIIDRFDPMATVTPRTAEPTTLTSVTFDIVFNKDVTGFTAEDIVVTVQSGQGSAWVTNFAGSGSSYSFSLLVSRTQTITVAVQIPAGAATDAMGRSSLAAAYQDGVDNAFTFEYPSGPVSEGDIYLSDGSLGDLTVTGGSMVINTGTTPPFLQYGSNPAIYGQILNIPSGNVAKFNFRNVAVNDSVSVSVTGNRPLVLAASGDMRWDATLDVSGTVAGRAGGGIGGAGGTAGSGGNGGAGGTSGGGGGAAAPGGGGGNEATGGGGLPGAGRNSGTAGAIGSAGAAGGNGGTGGAGTLGFGGEGTAGAGGARGYGGTPQSVANGGGAGAASGGGGGGGAGQFGPNNGDPGGNAWAEGVNGGNGGSGASGGSGTNGSAGVPAAFTAAANTLSLAAGHGGGGGGGGGGGAGGQGGGKGGGGSSGAGGGGGGMAYNTWVAQCGSPVINGYGGPGGGGGAGGGGGNGGSGGNGGAGGAGGKGGNGGGVAVLAARGILRFGGTVNISSSAPGGGTAGSAGSAGTGGVDPGNNWQGGYGGAGGGQGLYWVLFYGCWPQNNWGGAGGAGTRGGRGGVGGTGGSGGAGGNGAPGGLGTPGMVKLHGSVILASSGYVTCENHTANTSDVYKGRATLISNMRSPSLPVFSDDCLVGYTTNNSVLRASAPYDTSIQVPLLGDLRGNVVATGGILKSGFWNRTAYLAKRQGSPLIEVVALRNTESPFSGFDQIFVTNNGATTQEHVVVFVDGCDPLVIGALAPGEIWTTTVPANRNVVAYTQLEASINEPSVQTYLGASFTLTATVSGGVTPRVTRWKRNGLTVTSGWDQYTFTVNPVQASHAGQYTLEVTDGAGQTVLTDPPVPVTVNPPVTITTQPASASVVQGGNVVFTVAASGGYPPLSYDWRKDGVSLSRPSLPYLALGPVSPADAGTYDVVVTDALGMPVFGQVTSAPATLTVTTPLAIAVQPEPVTAYEDEPQVVFSVTAQGGTPPYTYTWLKDGAPLPPAEQPNGPTLTLPAPLASRAGTYRCVVSDSYVPPAQVQSDPATLTVYPRLTITAQPQGGTFERFSSTTLTVGVSGGAPGRTYVWRKNGVPLPVEQQPQTWALTLNNLQYADAGAYDVVVYDGYTDEITSDQAVITVTPPPALTITRQPQGGSTKIGASWVFTVETSGGEGAITYQWKFDDGTGPVNVGNNQPFLFLNNLQPEMEGVYWVEITDEARTVVSQPAQLVLVNQPLIQITQHPQSAQVPAGGSVTFTVVVTGGVYPLTFTWKFDDGSGNVVTVGENSPTLTLTGLTRAQSGTYYVVVSDQYETVTSDPATLLVTLAITAQPQGVTVRAGEPIELSVTADGGTGTLHYQWKFEAAGGSKSVVNVGEDSPTLVIPNASAEDAGNYWVEVSDNNTFVVSDPATVVVLTEPPVPVGGIGLLAALGMIVGTAGAITIRRKK